MSLKERRQLAKKIRELRIEQGLTQEEAANNCGVAYKAYQLYESKKTPDVRLSTIVKLAKGFGVTIGDLFT